VRTDCDPEPVTPGARSYRIGVQSPETESPQTKSAPTTRADRVDMAIGTAGSLVLNLGYLLLFHTDQRMLLLLFASAVIGMGLLLSEARGAVGMGILIGAGVAIAAALAIVAIGPGSIIHDPNSGHTILNPAG
jgi:hypothetical protein